MFINFAEGDGVPRLDIRLDTGRWEYEDRLDRRLITVESATLIQHISVYLAERGILNPDNQQRYAAGLHCRALAYWEGKEGEEGVRIRRYCC
jgi:hypothetical protein